MSVTGSTSSQGTHSRSPSRSRSPPYNDGRYPHPPPPLLPNSSKYTSGSSSSRYDYSYGRPSRSGISADLDSYRDLRERERDRERDRDRAMREDRYMSSRARDRDRDDRYGPYYREDPHHYPPHISRDYSKMSSIPLRREDSKDPKLTSSLKDGKDDIKTLPPSSSDMPPSYGSSRYNDWRERERERERRYREEDRRREYDRRRGRYMRYDPNYGPSYPPYGGGDTYRPDRDRDRDRDRDMPPPSLLSSASVSGPLLPPGPPGPPHPPHSSYYDRLDERDYYGGGSSSSKPLSVNDRYRSSSGRGRASWRDRPERISTANLDIRSGRSSPTTPYSAASASSTLKERTINDAAIKPLPSPSPPSPSASHPTLSANQTSSSSTAVLIAEEKRKDDTAKSSTKEKPVEELSTTDDRKSGQQTATDDKELASEHKGRELAYEAERQAIDTVAMEEKKDVSDDEKPDSIKEDISTAGMDQAIENDKQGKDEKATKGSSTAKPDIVPEPMQLDKSESPTEVLKVESESALPTKEAKENSTTSTMDENGEEEKEEGEMMIDEETDDVAKDGKQFSNLTQEQIVDRIDDIENQISTYEEMLEEAIKREEKVEERGEDKPAIKDEDIVMSDKEIDEHEEVTEEERAMNKEEAKRQALQAMEIEPSSSDASSNKNSTVGSVSSINATDKMRKRPQLLINQLRAKSDDLDDELYEKILRDNQQTAKQNSAMLNGQWQGKAENLEEWSDEERWYKPLYSNIEDYPCIQENMARFAQLRIDVAHALHDQKEALKKKERSLKNEYKRIYKEWKEKNLALDRMRAHERKTSDKYTGTGSTHYYRSSTRGHRRDEPEEYSDGVIFIAGAPDALRFKSDGTTTPYGGSGHFTSDAARSEAELLEIIQSLESAEMRNPESRAKKTTATIPPMILDERERMRTYDDRSGLVKDPLTYYHTGPNTGDVWNQQEVTTFMESYMMYPKQFERIAAAIGTKNARQCVLFYYRKKKKIDFKALMKKGRRGKSNKHRDRIAAAIRAATGDGSGNGSTTRKKAKSKGSALMTDIGEAQISRKAKEKDAAERKTRELKNLDEVNAYWDSAAEKRSSGRPKRYASTAADSGVIPGSGPSSSATDDTDMILQTPSTSVNTQQSSATDRKRVNSSSSQTSGRRRGRTPREATVDHILTPTDGNKRFVEEPSDMAIDSDDKMSSFTTTPPTASPSSVARWTERDKEIAIEAFKQYGRDFVKVANVLKTKTEEQCRNFYHNFKRKFGPNAFNEEENARQQQQPQQQQQQQQRVIEPTKNAMTVGGGMTTLVLPPNQPPATIATLPSQASIHNEVVASGRTDLKADEEDAAAALVGLFQMGANTPREEVKQQQQQQQQQQEQAASATSASTLSIRPLATNVLPNVAIPATSAYQVLPSPSFIKAAPVASTQQQQQQQQPQRRRRVRSSSSRAESLASEDTDYMPADNNGRKLGRQSTLAAAPSDNIKRSSYSSYWSVLERNDFQHYLSLYGPDWEKVASAMKTKTMIQVRNFYTNNEEKLHLKDIVDKFYARQQQQQQQLQQQQQQQHKPINSPAITTNTVDMSVAPQPYQSNTIMRNHYPYPTSNTTVTTPTTPSLASPMLDKKPIPSSIQPIIPTSASPHLQPQQPSSPYMMSPAQASGPANYYATSPQQQPLPPYPTATNTVTRPYAQPLPSPATVPSKPTQSQISEPPSAVTKVADLLNNNDDESTQPNQKSWETWFGN